MRRVFAMLALAALAAVALADWRGAFDDAFFAQRTVAVAMPTGLVAHLKMNDNAASTTLVESVSGNNGSINANTDARHTNGVIDGAIYFNGSSDYGKAREFATTGSWSIAFWVYFEAASRVNAQFFEERTAGSGNRLFCISATATTGGVYALVTGDEGGWYSTPNKVFPPSTLKHIAVTLDGDKNWIMWTNGTAAYTTNIAAFSGNTGFQEGLHIMGHPNYGWQGDGAAWIKGWIDDLRIYNHGLTSNEIALIYNGGAGTED
jgi:hypothetical protein